MKKAELIKAYNLYRSPYKAIFKDGTTPVTRTLYYQKNSDTYFIFYQNDLGIFKKYEHEKVSDIEKSGVVHGHVTAYRSWYKVN